MATKAQARVKLGVDKTELEKGLKDATKDFGSFATGLNQSLELLSKAGGFITGVFGGISGSIKEMTDLSSKQLELERDLAQAMKLRGQFTQEAFDEQKRLSGAIQNATTHGDEYILQLKTQLTLYGVEAKNLQEATKAVIGATEAKVREKTAVQEVAKLYRGEVSSSLRTAGLAGKTTGDTIKNLVGNFSLAEARAHTFAGRMQQLANAWGDLKENVGHIITRSSALQEILKSFTDFIGVGSTLNITTMALIFDKFVRGLAGVAATIITAMRGLVDFVKTDLKTILAELSKPPEQRSKDFLGGALSGIAGLIGDPFGVGAEAQRRLRAREASETGVRKPINTGGGQDAFDILADTLRAISDGDASISDALAGIGSGQGGQAGPAGKERATRERFDEITDLSGLSAEELIYGPLSPETRKQLLDESIKVDEEAAAQLEQIYQNLVANNHSARVRFIENEKEALEARKAIAADEVITAEERARLLAQIDEKQLAFTEATSQRKIEIANAAAQHVSGFLTQLVADAAAGEESFGTILKRLFGGLLVTVGSSLISLGVSAIAGGAIGEVAPWLKGVTGGEAAIAAGVAATIAGAGLVAAGSVISAGGKSRSTAPSFGSAGGRGTTSPPAPTLFRSPTEARAGSQSIAFQAPLRGRGDAIVYNLNFYQPAGDPRSTARYFANFMERHLGPLQPAGGR